MSEGYFIGWATKPPAAERFGRVIAELTYLVFCILARPIGFLVG